MADRDIIKPHSFDGIQEYDNDLPKWWLAVLWLSILWAIAYIGYYHLEGAPLGAAELKIEVAKATEERLKNSTGPLDEDLMRGLSHNPDRLAKGANVFAKNQCATCHGSEGNGLINGNPGPGANLRDGFWLHGSDMTDIVHIITEGFLEKGMPAQKSLLSEDEILSVACFVADGSRKPIAGKPHDPKRGAEQPITW